MNAPAGAARWIVNARLIDGLGNPPVTAGAVSIGAGRITAVGADLRPSPSFAGEVVNLDGRTLLPGFINLHSHLFRRARVDDAIRIHHNNTNPATTVMEVLRALRNAFDDISQGITTGRELGARDFLDVQLRDMIASGQVIGPRIFACGRPITRTGGHNWDFSREADGPPEVRKAVREALKGGADVIKVMASWGGIEMGREHRRSALAGVPAPAYAGYTIEEMAAAVDEAHANARRVTVHAESAESVIRAVKAGVDSVEHGTHLSPEAIELMCERGTYLVPTISTVFRRVANAEAGAGADWGDEVMFWARLATEPWKASLERAIAAGVPVATGTDAGGDIVDEIQLIAECGLPPLQAIRSATGLAAAALGREDLGALAVGRWADMIVVDGQPERDLTHLRAVRQVYKAGERVNLRPPTELNMVHAAFAQEDQN
jgi:imidazolonepropionase-like amidohydrolase